MPANAGVSSLFSYMKTLAKEANYLVPDLLAPQLKLVFCGTAPSRASVAAAAYYAKPGNRFWPTLHAVGITPHRYSPREYPQLLTLGIGLTDLCKIHSGVDSELPDNAFDVDAFEKKMQHHQPRIVAFTSKNAAQSYLKISVAYGMQSTKLGDSKLFVLPSPSGLATRFFDIDVWRALADEIKRL
jgi:double-stranded uracil-DNA glycosylase